jgi:hypothetical protein
MMKHTTKYVTIFFLLLSLAAIFAAPSSIAEDTPELLPLDPVPMVQISDGTTLQPAPPERVAVIEQIHPHCFVIGDICRSFSSNAVFRRSAGGPATSRAAFRVGDYVGFRFNTAHEIEEIWLAEPPVDTR